VKENRKNQKYLRGWYPCGVVRRSGVSGRETPLKESAKRVILN